MRHKTQTFNNNGAHDVQRYHYFLLIDIMFDTMRCCLCCTFFFFPISPDGAHSDESTPDPSQAIYAEFDDDFEDEELSAPIGKCTAMYNFPGIKALLAYCLTHLLYVEHCV